jgi:hypothetical protein
MKNSASTFVETALGPPDHQKYCVDVSRPGTHQNALRYPHIKLDTKTQVWRDMSDCAICAIRTGPT